MQVYNVSQYLPPLVSGFAAWGLLSLRLAWGTALIQHGWLKVKHPLDWMDIEARKHSGFPGYLQAIAAFTIFLGGIAMMVGLFTPIAASTLAGMMAVALLLHLMNGLPFIKQIPDAPGDSYEASLVYLAIALLFLLVGAGNLSLDALLFYPH
ncbi:DoxX family protein [Oscillatoria sp. FACHB-1407]|uniref:DoxX family protein n=1 Tax=Oscillatoria sp. FACHB-1407 TaxID=2692847 RepID=UPI0016826616|nr:DoxX family protein [Oscillatoria sp. FACHB-1407]MBD2465867.1 DoxX family protein [Oscillatoria sp. FACHB-1407]